VALGLTEASRKKATKTAKRLIGKGGATAEQLQALADDLVKTSLANREAITKLVRYELDRALGVVGLATADEVADLTKRVRDLEQQLRAGQAGRRARRGPPPSPR
jgi:polyhydroxyalkanoate synthesis regulator phasin